jgi:CRISPR/Cas system-associated exonuclease Cas4 (RecB family)
LRTRWEDIPGASADLQARFDTGKALHQVCEETFREAGFQVYTSPDPLEDKELQVSGRMDFEIALDDTKPIPVEIKSVEDWDIDKYHGVEDMLNGKWWVRGYLAQLGLYCWMRNREKGILHLRSLKRWRNIELSILDEKVIGFVQELMEKLKTVNQHIGNGTLPDRIEWDDSICGKCNAKHICLPEEKISNGEVLLDEELEAMLERREELSSAKREFEELDKEIKSKVKEKPKVLVGNFIIEGKWQERKETIIPASRFWVIKIKKII